MNAVDLIDRLKDRLEQFYRQEIASLEKEITWLSSVFSLESLVSAAAETGRKTTEDHLREVIEDL